MLLLNLMKKKEEPILKLNKESKNTYGEILLPNDSKYGEKCKEVIDKFKDEELNVDDPNYKKYQNCIEKINEEQLKETTDIKGIYPGLDDPNFQNKITDKIEFFENKYQTINSEDIINIEKKVNELCQNRIFELSPHQLFVKNFLSTKTPYNSILLFHGLGTGKTCSSIQVAEEMRIFLNKMNINKKIIIVASPVVQENYKLQLFDERKLKKVGGRWDIKSCTGNAIIKEINPIDVDISREKLVKLIKKKIKNGYIFMGYNKFSNFINNITNKYGIKNDDDEKNKRKKAKLIKREFSNRLIIIDEVQNIRNVKLIETSIPYTYLTLKI